MLIALLSVASLDMYHVFLVDCPTAVDYQRDYYQHVSTCISANISDKCKFWKLCLHLVYLSKHVMSAPHLTAMSERLSELWSMSVIPSEVSGQQTCHCWNCWTEHVSCLDGATSS